jgi:hypothetical protein
MPDNKHRDLRPVFTLVPNLLRDEIVRVETLDLGNPADAPPLFILELFIESILRHDPRRREPSERPEEPRLVSVPRHGDRANEIRRDAFDMFPIFQRVYVDLVFNLGCGGASEVVVR